MNVVRTIATTALILNRATENVSEIQQKVGQTKLNPRAGLICMHMCLCLCLSAKGEVRHCKCDSAKRWVGKFCQTSNSVLLSFFSCACSSMSVQSDVKEDVAEARRANATNRKVKATVQHTLVVLPQSSASLNCCC